MSAEQKQQLHDISSRASNENGIIQAAAFQTQLACDIVEKYDRGMLSLEEAVAGIVELFQIVYNDTLRVESTRLARFAQVNGFETLTTDTQGSRPAEWFETTGKPFATGIASNCIACAIINNETGMAASHKNTVNVSDYKKFMRRALDDEQLRLALIQNPSLYGLFVTPASLLNSVSTAVNQAFDNFSTLAPKGIPPTGTQIFFAGLDYLVEEKIQPVIDVAGQVIRQRVSQEGKMIGVKKSINIEFIGLGHALGIIYGGRNNPLYSTPQFYEMR